MGIVICVKKVKKNGMIDGRDKFPSYVEVISILGVILLFRGLLLGICIGFKKNS